jgi:hypothetical protein
MDQILNALLLKAKRMMPAPSIVRVTGQGKGHPNKGLGTPIAISIASRIKSAPAMMRRIFEALSIFHLHYLSINGVESSAYKQPHNGFGYFFDALDGFSYLFKSHLIASSSRSLTERSSVMASILIFFRASSSIVVVNCFRFIGSFLS